MALLAWHAQYSHHAPRCALRMNWSHPEHHNTHYYGDFFYSVTRLNSKPKNTKKGTLKHARIIANTLLLSLVMLLNDIDEADSCAQLLKLNPTERLSEYVTQLINSSNELH
jgi:hypothetical protein